MHCHATCNEAKDRAGAWHGRRRSKSPYVIAALILVACIGCDQATKALATQPLRHAPPRSYFHDTLRLEYALNPGGFLSLGRGLPALLRRLVFIGFNTVLLLGVGLFLLHQRDIPPVRAVALIFILAGGIGNLIDRILHHGDVVDFISVGLGPVRTGIFNVADVAMTFGALAVLLQMRRRSPSGRPVRDR